VATATAGGDRDRRAATVAAIARVDRAPVRAFARAAIVAASGIVRAATVRAAPVRVATVRAATVRAATVAATATGPAVAVADSARAAIEAAVAMITDGPRAAVIPATVPAGDRGEFTGLTERRPWRLPTTVQW
jgi:hypothetical protein